MKETSYDIKRVKMVSWSSLQKIILNFYQRKNTNNSKQSTKNPNCMRTCVQTNTGANPLRAMKGKRKIVSYIHNHGKQSE